MKVIKKVNKLIKKLIFKFKHFPIKDEKVGPTRQRSQEAAVPTQLLLTHKYPTSNLDH